MRVVVFGATGVVGRQVLPRLVERGHRVRAVVRSAEKAASLQVLGVETQLGDILDAAVTELAVTGCDAALHFATAIPSAGGVQDWDPNDRIRRDGTRHLLAACQRAGCRRYIQQSIAFMCGDAGDPADEYVPLAQIAFLQSALDMEAMVQASALDWCILRGGAFYGPHTFEDAWRDAARDGLLQFPGDADSRLSLIHPVDMARATLLATERAAAGTVYHVVDDEPVSYRQLFAHVAALCGVPAPTRTGPAFLPAFAASNQRLKTELDWAPAYPTYRSGMS